MSKQEQYYVVKEKALSGVLRRVVEAKRLLDAGKAQTVQEAADAVGISRSSFYKYKDDIFLFREDTKGKKITFVTQVVDDRPGMLSGVLRIIAGYQANILTINQTIPVNGVASLTISIDLLPEAGDAMQMFKEIEQLDGIHYVKILASE